MDNEPIAPMQVDLSTNTMSVIQAFKLDPSTEWVIKSAPGFIAIKHKMGCSICDASASHCMAAKRSYKICLTEKDVSHTVTEAWPELNLDDQVQSLEPQLQEIKSNSDKLPKHKELILENKHLQQELDYYVGRAQYALYRKDANWATHNGYCISDIPASHSEDDGEDLGGLPTIAEGIPQDVPSGPPTKLACPVGKLNWNDSKVVHEAGIPAIGGSCLPPTPKRIIADPPTSITGVLPRPLGNSRAEHWDQPALRGAESNVHDSEMCRLYIEGRALQPHEWSSDHTVVIFCIDKYAKSLPGLPRGLMVCPDDPDWMINVIQTFNVNPSGIPRNLQLEGVHINVDTADIWYWLNLIKPKFCGAEAEVLLQSIFSTVGKWDQMIAGTTYNCAGRNTQVEAKSLQYKSLAFPTGNVGLLPRGLPADQVVQGVPESIECSWCSIRDPQSIDMNALREEIKETISATIKDKLCSDADSVTTVSQSAARHSCRALELQLKLAEEKVNTPLHEEAPEEALLEAAQEVQTIHFQLDQNTRLCEAGLMPEQQMRFSADTGRNVTSPSRNYGVNPINEAHTPQPEADAPFG
ncbi:hypothetical protein M422DRAFT_256507 [Sphaerobolus stellatus SS14]|uniref:Uncharacterized protein n=1 Tax=Sphaerobolus stellatus (strain SS14) TaxID=990650 RepID=A0A0C9V0B6_SPHS4|nr:hypothetical protein M422DRAFT_256507 [Sphaerobolus stellatus SS14]